MENYYKNLKKEVRTYNKKLKELATKKEMLKAMRKYMTEEEYEEELRKIEMETSTVTNRLVEVKEQLNTPKVTEEYFDTLEKLVKLYNETEDLEYKKVISEEINKKRNEVIKLNQQLPEELQGDLEKLYGSVEIENDEELTKISKSIDMLEEITKDYYARKAQIINKIGTTYDNDTIENQLLRQEYTEELKNIKEEISVIEKYLVDKNKKYEARAKMLKEAKVAKITPKAYDKIINYAKSKERLEKVCREHGLTGIADRMSEIKPISDTLRRKYEKEINSYLKKKVKPQVEEKVDYRPTYKEPSITPEYKAKKEEAEEVKEEQNDNIKEMIEEKIKNLSNKEIEEKLNNPEIEYGYKTIIKKLVEGLEPKSYDGIGYEISNIKMKENFKKEISTGNFIYNVIHIVPAAAKLPLIGAQKVVNKFLYRKSAQKRMSKIKERLDKLPEQDLEILLKEYKNHIGAEKYGSALNILINERLEKYTNEKVAKLNKRIEANYEDLFDTMYKVQIADQKARDKSLSDDKRYEYILIKQKLLEGRAQQVKSVRDDYNAAKDIISNGMAGFTSAAKDTALKNSYVGYFFARERKLDKDLLSREASLEQAEKNAIANNNDEMALRVFIENEKLLCKNTKIKNSIFGKRSVGKKYYQPLAEKLEGVRIPLAKKKKVTYGNKAIEKVEEYCEKEKVLVR